MQPPTVDPRGTFTSDQIIALIKTDESMIVGAGCELLNRDLRVLADLTDNLAGGDVSRANFATLHGSCGIKLTTPLQWGSAIVRPYMTLSNGVITARFNLGAYFTSTPDYVTGVDPTTYDVIGYDMLSALDVPIGDTYSLPLGYNYLQTIESILVNQGYTRYVIDPLRRYTTTPARRGWLMSDNVTWLTVVNDLLAAIGYRGIYADWDGVLKCVPYISPESTPPEWIYDDGQFTSQMYPQQTVIHDYYQTPNKWIGVRSNGIDGVTPTEGNGIFTYQNNSDGETSIEARSRVITAKLDIEAADQAALVSAVMQQVAQDKRVGTTIQASSTPNPLHWHFDVLTITTKELGTVKVRENEWTLPLDGSSMSHAWAVL